MKFLVQIFFLLGTFSSLAQEQVLMTKNFEFEDGIYLSFEELRKNQPTYRWFQTEVSIATNPQTFAAKLERLRLLSGKALAIEDIFAISIGGLPYIYVPGVGEEMGISYFAGLRVRGKICYFDYEDEVTEMVTIKAYNPLTGKPFRSGQVPRKQQVEIKKMLDFVNGEIYSFTVENLLKLIKDDENLWTTVNDMNAEEADEKLFRILLIYVDRNEVYIKKTEN